MKSYAIIIGSMKSGTTSLYKYLIKHPEICPAITKEPEFFSENQLHKIRCERYSDLWSFNKTKHKVALEASTGYTKYPFETNVPERIFEYGIRPKMIYCVRNPFERILSQYKFAKNFSNWGNHSILSPKVICLSKYYLQLQQFRKFFTKEDILIIDFKDISSNPQKAINHVFNFLNLNPIELDHFNVYNKTSNLLDKNRVKNLKEVMERKITRFERKQLFLHLKSDMKAFNEEYNFNVSQWGF